MADKAVSLEVSKQGENFYASTSEKYNTFSHLLWRNKHAKTEEDEAVAIFARLQMVRFVQKLKKQENYHGKFLTFPASNSIFDGPHRREIIREEAIKTRVLKSRKQAVGTRGRFDFHITLKEHVKELPALAKEQLPNLVILRKRYEFLRCKLKSEKHTVTFVDIPSTISTLKIANKECNGFLRIGWEMPDANGKPIEYYQFFIEPWSMQRDEYYTKNDLNEKKFSLSRRLRAVAAPTPLSDASIEEIYEEELIKWGVLVRRSLSECSPLDASSNFCSTLLSYEMCTVDATHSWPYTCGSAEKIPSSAKNKIFCQTLLAAYVSLRSYNEEGWSLWSPSQFIIFSLGNAATIQKSSLYTWGSTESIFCDAEGDEKIQICGIPHNIFDEIPPELNSLVCFHSLDCRSGLAAVCWDGSLFYSVGYTFSYYHRQTVPYKLDNGYFHQFLWNEANNTAHILHSVDSNQFSVGCITAEGFLYVWGQNNYGQCLSLERCILHPKKMPFSVPIIKVCFGWESVMCLTNEGKVYFWGASADSSLDPQTLTEKICFDQNSAFQFPRQLSFGNKKVVFIEANSDCFAAITDNGVLWTWGDNTHLQLGSALLAFTKHLSSPMQVPFFLQHASLPMLSISFGYRHAAAVNAAGEVYTWGISNKGQCGHDSLERIIEPLKIDFFTDAIPPLPKTATCIEVSCGVFQTVFTMAVPRTPPLSVAPSSKDSFVSSPPAVITPSATDSVSLPFSAFSLKDSSTTALPLEDSSTTNTPLPLDSFKTLSSVNASPSHSLPPCIDIYVCGENKLACLGITENPTTKASRPHRIPSLSHSHPACLLKPSQIVEQVKCGNSHISAFITEYS